MGFFKDDDEINLESISSEAYADLNQRMAEYDGKNKSTNGKGEKRKRPFTSCIVCVFILAVLGLFVYIELNFEKLCLEYNISPGSLGHTKAMRYLAFSIIVPLIPYALGLLLLAAAGIFIYYMVKAKKNPKSLDDYLKINDVENESLIGDGFTPFSSDSSSFSSPDQKPSPYFSPNNYTDEINSFLKGTDYEFDAAEFIDWCEKSFCSYWDAWSDGNIETAGIFLSEDLLDKTRSLLLDNKDANRKDIYKVYAVMGTYINKYERELGFEYLTVYLTSIHRRYVLDSRRVNSGVPFSGSISKDLKTIYQLKFMRRFAPEHKTNIKNGVQIVVCPSCGAEVSALNMGRCEFCGGIIKVGEFSWVLSDIDEYFRNVSPADNRGIVIHDSV